MKRATVLDAIRCLTNKDLANLDAHYTSITPKSSMNFALILLQQGLAVEDVSKHLTWKDFEGLVSIMLTENNYSIYRNLRLRRPRTEIDIFAKRYEMGLAVDCKHWLRPVGPTTMARVADMQVRRAEALMKSNYPFKEGVLCMVPTIVSLYSQNFMAVKGVPVVPVSKFTSFLLDLKGNIGLFKLVQ